MTPDFILSLAEGHVTLAIGGERAEWNSAEFPRGLLHVLVPAKGGGEIALLGVSVAGERTDLLTWPQFDAAVYATLIEHEAELRRLFPGGFSVHAAADA